MSSNYIKQTFYEDDRFKIYLEEVDGYLMAHLAIYSFSKSIYRDIIEMWIDIQNRAWIFGYDEIYTYTKEERMFKLFPNAEKLGEVEQHGVKYGIWKWDLNSV